MIETTTNLPVFITNDKGKIIISERIQKQIDYLHKKVGGVEWCGVLFYEKTSGEINNPSTLVFTAKDIYLMNIGSHSYTESEFDSGDIIGMYENIPNAEEMKRGMIHTHHSMQAFFSGTDNSELQDNTQFHDYYLSLIVNFDGKYCAKIAYHCVLDSKYTIKNGSLEGFNNSQEVLMTTDLEIVYEDGVGLDPSFIDRYVAIDAKKTTYTYPSYNSLGAGNKSYSSFTNAAYRGKYHDWDNDINSEKTLFDDISYSQWDDCEEEKKYAKPHYNKSSKKNLEKVPKVIGRDGKTKIRIDRAKLETDLLAFLLEGLQVYHDMNLQNVPNSLVDLLEYYEDYFEGGKSPKLNYFIDCLYVKLKDYFTDIHPNIVRNFCVNTLEEFDEFEITVDFIMIFEAYPEYLEELKELQNGK